MASLFSVSTLFVMVEWRAFDRLRSGLRRVFFAGLLFCTGTTSVFADDAIAQLLAGAEAPDGVVFEIVAADDSALEQLLPRVNEAIVKIRARFPATEFAIVSHGREEFALQSRYRTEYSEVHQLAHSLVNDEVSLHVCETHAGWYDVSAEDFPEYVNVAPSGPAQVDLYQELGYELILVD